MIDWLGIFAVIGTLSIGVALLVLGALSRRLGRVTRSKAYYVGFYVSALMVAVGVVARLMNLSDSVASIADLHHNIVWVLLYHGVPAVGVTLGVMIAWRYWSWLLAERG